MSRKCDAKCDATSNLWLRNNVYYYIVELQRVNGKRRYLRQSLHTNNYYEARERIKNMNGLKYPFNEIRRLLDNLIYETSNGQSGTLQALSNLPGAKKVSKRNNPDVINELVLLGGIAEYTKNASPVELAILNELKALRLEVADLRKKPTQTIKPIQLLKISEVMDDWLHNANTGNATEDRRKNAVIKMLSDVGLKLDSDYSKFHNIDIFKSISNNVMKLKNKNNSKRLYISYLKAIAQCGMLRDSDNYKSNVLIGLPKIAKTDRSDIDPHLPYTNDQLLKIFDPKHTFFKENPDTFFACMVALFTGARLNAATTLQYDNIINENGIDCIQFTKAHEIKKLKNGATKRSVPINPQLIDMGFLDYVKRHKAKSKATGTGFIFPACCTKGGNFNNKFTLYLTKFLMDIGVKKDSHDGYDFHSFRKTINMNMIKAGITKPFRDNIIGWDNKDMSDGTYFQPTTNDLKSEVDKFKYEFLQSHFDKWKVIMAKK